MGLSYLCSRFDLISLGSDSYWRLVDAEGVLGHSSEELPILTPPVGRAVVKAL